MSRSSSPRADRLRRLLTSLLLIVLAGTPALTACGSSDKSANSSNANSDGSAVTVDGVKVTKVAAIAGTVPKAAQKAGLNAIFYNYYPPEFFESKGKLIGAQVDLAHAIAAVLGIPLKTTTSASFDSFIPSVQSARFNAAFGAFLVTPERTKVVDIVSNESTGTGFASKAGGDAATLSTDLDLCGKKFAGITASAYVASVEAVNDKCSAAGMPQLTVATYPTDSAAELAVESGRQDYYVSGANEISWRFAEPGQKLTAQPLNFEPVATGIAVGKNSGLSQPMTDAINQLIKSGAYKAIMSKWHLENFVVPKAELFG